MWAQAVCDAVAQATADAGFSDAELAASRADGTLVAHRDPVAAWDLIHNNSRGSAAKLPWPLDWYALVSEKPCSERPPDLNPWARHRPPRRGL